VPREAIEPVALPAVTVSDVVLDEQDLSFAVDQVGVPVLVKVSYFPNWTAHGAEGPYRIAPNLMVVVPTSEQVSLTFDRSSSDLFFYVLTLLGIGLLVFFRIRGDTDLSEPVPVAAGVPSSPAGAATEDPFGAPPVWSPRRADDGATANGHVGDDPATDPPAPDGPPGRPLA
jgi:hypothetical protein